MNRVIILGSGSASGVPSITGNWCDCNPENPKNRRTRAGIFVELGDTRILVDTSADIRQQCLDNNIQSVDAVLYTHTHADHTFGIDDLRGFTYGHPHKNLDIYAIAEQIVELRQRFGYALSSESKNQITHHPELVAHTLHFGEEFKIKDTLITPLEFRGHPVVTTGYCFNNGALVIIPDYAEIPEVTMRYLKQIDVNLLIMPLTAMADCLYHADMQKDLAYIKAINPQKTVLTHMSGHCDYDAVAALTPDNVLPAYDNMIIEL